MPNQSRAYALRERSALKGREDEKTESEVNDSTTNETSSRRRPSDINITSRGGRDASSLVNAFVSPIRTQDYRIRKIRRIATPRETLREQFNAHQGPLNLQKLPKSPPVWWSRSKTQVNDSEGEDIVVGVPPEDPFGETTQSVLRKRARQDLNYNYIRGLGPPIPFDPLNRRPSEVYHQQTYARFRNEESPCSGKERAELGLARLAIRPRKPYGQLQSARLPAAKAPSSPRSPQKVTHFARVAILMRQAKTATRIVQVKKMKNDMK